MGCLKLTYYQDFEPQKNTFGEELTSKISSEPLCSSYLFGFNGKEKDDEWNGQTGSTYDFGARLYDARIGRWMACDPLAVKYPNLSPYNFVANSPINSIDPNGKTIFIVIGDQKIEYIPGVPYDGNNEFVKYTYEALDFLSSYENSESPEFKVITELSNDKNVSVSVIESDFMTYSGNAGNPEWNPKTGAIITDATTGEKAIQSPISILYHEVAHSYDEIYGTISDIKTSPLNPSMEEIEEYFKQIESYITGKDMKWDRPEEKGVIQKVEQSFNKYMGTPFRDDHDTFGFPAVSDPYSNVECVSCGQNENIGTEIELNNNSNGSSYEKW